MYNKERVKTIVSEWFEFKTGIVLSDETLSKLVDDITETKQCDIPVVTTRLNVGTKIFKKHRCCVGTIRYKSDFGFNHWIVEWDNGNWTSEYGLDLNVW